jgi:hypothetical protein
VGSASTVLQCNRVSDKVAVVTPDLPGNVILVHGVNDVGTGYEAAERGLCAGLSQRLDQPALRPAGYRLPGAEDNRRLEPDPDAVFFKRTAMQATHSPVIPFYWGYRPAEGDYKSYKVTRHGQAVDRWGNRLDRDFSKGGGPFANATTTLVDMWNRGFGVPPGNPVDWKQDQLRQGILEWKKFVEQFKEYYDAEEDWRKELIYGNCAYYSTGELPECLPLITQLPAAVVNETMSGLRIGPTPKADESAAAAQQPLKRRGLGGKEETQR